MLVVLQRLGNAIIVQVGLNPLQGYFLGDAKSVYDSRSVRWQWILCMFGMYQNGGLLHINCQNYELTPRHVYVMCAKGAYSSQRDMTYRKLPMFERRQSCSRISFT